MARITIEDCLERVSNRFLLCNMAAKRVRQIRDGSEYLVSSPKNEDVVVALREIAAGKVVLKKEQEKEKKVEKEKKEEKEEKEEKEKKEEKEEKD